MKVSGILKFEVSKFNRKRKLAHILNQIQKHDSILDIGVMPIQEKSTNGTNYINEYFREMNRKIDALGLENEDYSFFERYYSNCTLHTFDGMDFSILKKVYDVAISNAVIEHVGRRREQLQWLEGIRGICHKLVITTPNRFFPVEAHTNVIFKHLISKKFKQRLLEEMQINLFSLKEFIDILEAAGYKILSVKKNRVLFLSLDFVIVCVPRNACPNSSKSGKKPREKAVQQRIYPMLPGL